MITIVAKSTVKKGQEEAFIAMTKDLIEASQQEVGCLSYGLYRDLNDPQVFTFIEEWQDQAAIDRHNASEHFVRIVPQLAAFREGPSEVRLYQRLS
ncbi:putative quinol monooxygenase [Anoxynatronum sibiricum]|uniref:Quinol monooxygenase n=1 Tax=Anoxynatronum sibiricum TaxID=210623 RepID=A0ABU9VP15_9CLOT